MYTNTNFAELGSYLEAVSHSAEQEIPIWNVHTHN
jgi:hypothetical protein